MKFGSKPSRHFEHCKGADTHRERFLELCSPALNPSDTLGLSAEVYSIQFLTHREDGAWGPGAVAPDGRIYAMPTAAGGSVLPTPATHAILTQLKAGECSRYSI